MPEPRLLWDMILFSVSVVISIAVGILTFFKLFRHFGRSLFDCILAIAGSALAALCTFCIITTVFVLIRGRWCEGCQEYH